MLNVEWAKIQRQMIIVGFDFVKIEYLHLIMIRIFVIWMGLILLAGNTSAQKYKAEKWVRIYGTVTDSTGKPVAYTSLVLCNKRGIDQQFIKADSLGRFSFVMKKKLMHKRYLTCNIYGNQTALLLLKDFFKHGQVVKLPSNYFYSLKDGSLVYTYSQGRGFSTYRYYSGDLKHMPVPPMNTNDMVRGWFSMVK